jgi:hypothetical protein
MSVVLPLRNLAIAAANAKVFGSQAAGVMPRPVRNLNVWTKTRPEQGHRYGKRIGTRHSQVDPLRITIA